MQVAKELRADLIYHVSQTGGHLGSRFVNLFTDSNALVSFFRPAILRVFLLSLGVIELTVALNYVFDQPNVGNRCTWKRYNNSVQDTSKYSHAMYGDPPQRIESSGTLATR